MAYIENKVLKQKKLNKELNLKVTQNNMSGRIFVEFKSEDGKIILQRSFQDTHEGQVESEKFAKSLKSLSDLKKYFGITK